MNLAEVQDDKHLLLRYHLYHLHSQTPARTRNSFTTPRPTMDQRTLFPTALLLALPILLTFLLLPRYLRLRHIPGPPLASLSNLWAFIKIYRGERYHLFIQELHKQYGPVVRWGPNRVSYSQPAAIPIIYGTQNVFPKSASYSPLIVLAKGQEIPTLVTIRDERRISRMKSKISAGFSMRTWLMQEKEIDVTLEALIARLKGFGGQAVRLDEWLQLWSFDTITLLAFGESRGYIAHGRDVDGVYPAARERLGHWEIWSSLPGLERLIFKNWLVQRFQKSTSNLAGLALKQVQVREAGEKLNGENDLMGRYLAASRVVPDVITTRDVLALTISTIHAGSETVAMTCASILQQVLMNQEVYSRLKKEILDAGLTAPVSFGDAEKLPFLDAVVRETQRLAISPMASERTITPEGINICDTWIPAGTDVSISEGFICYDEGAYGDKPDSFRPQRWFDADERQFREMERASFHFGYGRRECIGKHLARIEIKKAIASLLATFEVCLFRISCGHGYADFVLDLSRSEIKSRMGPDHLRLRIVREIKFYCVKNLGVATLETVFHDDGKFTGYCSHDVMIIFFRKLNDAHHETLYHFLSPTPVHSC